MIIRWNAVQVGVWCVTMFNQDDFEYAIENTRVIRSPERRISTFGSTVFEFHLVTEMMDSVNEVRVRNGKIHAEKPQIMTPDRMSRLLLEGFGERAEEFADSMRRSMENMAFLKYGFSVRKTDVTESIVHDHMDSVLNRIAGEADASDDPMRAVIHGVDEGWEVCLLKFTVDIIRDSAGGNMNDFQQRGLL